MDSYLDFYEIAFNEIRKACKAALTLKSLNWRSDVSYPILNSLTGKAEWQADFFDEVGKFRCCVSFERPPHADVHGGDNPAVSSETNSLTAKHSKIL